MLQKAAQKARPKTKDDTDRLQPVRESLTLPRALEYLSENELTKQIGYPRHLWPLAIAKELLDNGLDNC